METEYVVWVTRPEKPAWCEEIFLETKDPQSVKRAVYLAKVNGFKNVRVMTFNGESPDFGDPRLINIKV